MLHHLEVGVNLSFEEIHRSACEVEAQTYMDPETGYTVLTSVYLREQGTCCGSGCRHCPFSRSAQKDAGRPENIPAYPWPPQFGNSDEEE